MFEYTVMDKINDSTFDAMKEANINWYKTLTQRQKRTGALARVANCLFYSCPMGCTDILYGYCPIENVVKTTKPVHVPNGFYLSQINSEYVTLLIINGIVVNFAVESTNGRIRTNGYISLKNYIAK